MTITRQHVTVALTCGSAGAVVGMAGGVLLGADLPDVTVAAAAVTVLIVWSLAAGYVGALIQRRGEEKRLDAMAALARLEGDDDALALYESLKEGR